MQLLVDFSSILYRAYHSTPPSVPTNAVYGCLNMLAKIIIDRKPERVGLGTDDAWRPEFRTRVLPQYKAHRVSDEPDPVVPQEVIARELLSAIGLAVVGAPGFEAEDVIATLAARTDEPVQILSGDRDLFALVRDPHVQVLYPTRGVTELSTVDEAEITRRYGIPGRSYGDFALLRGDPSDGLPGVAGIGEKTAAKLIAQYGSLEKLLAATDLPPAVRRKLDAGRDYLQRARQVVLPVATVPLPADVSLELPHAFADPAVVEELAEAHKLQSPVQRLAAALGIT
ncbi:MAG: 5'-3' exonuclease [Candidatus Xenobia bacterium]